MRDVLLIAKREYMERVRSRAFLVMTILFPISIGVLMAGSMGAARLGSGAKTLVIASNNAGLAREVAQEMHEHASAHSKQPIAKIVAPATEADREALTKRVETRQLDGYVWLEQEGGRVAKAQLVLRSAGDLFAASGLDDAVMRASERLQLQDHGASAAEISAIQQPVVFETLQVRGGKVVPANSMKSFFGAYAMMFLLYFTVVFYGMNVARSVVEEKTSRIYEVLLSTTEPQTLMAGKLLGVGAAGLTQLGIWIAAALVLLASQAGAALAQGGPGAFGIHPLQFAFFLVYFLLGFFFYSAIAAAVGACVNSEQELQQFSMIIVAPLTVGIVLITYIVSNPTALPVVLLSLFPPCTPIVMYLRLSSQMPPVWQLALSVVLLLVFIWGALWLASRIYRVGILMYGKRANLPELVRWLRYS